MSFPDGIPGRLYTPVLTLIASNMSQRAAARVFSVITGKDYHEVLNDVFGVLSPGSQVDRHAEEECIALLAPHGYEEWVRSQRLP